MIVNFNYMSTNNKAICCGIAAGGAMPVLDFVNSNLGVLVYIKYFY
jgi:hypothetical protein